MAGSITVTTSEDRQLSRYSCAWTSDGSGDVNGIDVLVRAGQIVQVVCSPGGTTPSDLYDVTLTLEDGGTDLLGGGGANCSNSTPQVVGVGLADLPVWVPTGNLRPVVANAGASKTGVIDIYIA